MQLVSTGGFWLLAICSLSSEAGSFTERAAGAHWFKKGAARSSISADTVCSIMLPRAPLLLHTKMQMICC
jgi:hypothetical protein